MLERAVEFGFGPELLQRASEPDVSIAMLVEVVEAVDPDRLPALDRVGHLQATRRAKNRLEAAKDEVKKIIRGLGGSDRMLIAQMDAAVTKLMSQ